MRSSRVVAAALVALLSVGSVVLATAGPAAAHASLRSTDPADGSEQETEPTTLTFEFTENVGRATVVLSAPDGTPVGVTGTRAVDDTVTAQVDEAGQRGTYTAAYRVVSADGHPIEGTVEYAVTTGRTVEQKAPADAGENQQGFVHRHRSHLFWGVLVAAVAVGLLLVPLKNRDETGDGAA